MARSSHMQYLAAALLALVCAGACLVALAGCTTEDYGRGDIARYVRETHGLRHVTVSSQPKEVRGEDGYTDYRWTVTTHDDPAVEFFVLDDHFWGMESLANSLRDDYDAAATLALLDDYGDMPLDVEVTTYDGSLRYVTLTGTFAGREELDDLLAATEGFLAYAREHCDATELEVPLSLTSPDAYLQSVEDDFVWEYPIDVNTTLSTAEDPGEQVAEAEADYLYGCIDYQLEDRLAEFSAGEVEEAVAASEHQLQVRRADGTTADYADLLAGESWNVSLGTLYQVLVREGFSPSGTGAHFSFVGTDGCTYEFCSDFQGAATGVTTQRGYSWETLDESRAIDRGYFLRNGEAYPLLNTCSRVDYRTVKCATGLELFDEWSLGTTYSWDISGYDV